MKTLALALTLMTFAAPAMAETFANPNGYGADNGTAYLSTSYQNTIQGANHSDGEATLGVGLGDAKDLGLELSYTIYSFGRSQGIGSGAFNAKVHKRYDDSSVAIGYQGLVPVRLAGGEGLPFDYPSGPYVAGTKYLTNNLAVTAGINQYVFASASYSIGEGVAIAEYTGAETVLALGYRPVATPLSATIGLRGQRLIAGLSYEVKF
jgi:hypothetical protein